MRTDLSNAADMRNTGVVKVLSHGVVAGPRFYCKYCCDQTTLDSRLLAAYRCVEDNRNSLKLRQLKRC